MDAADSAGEPDLLGPLRALWRRKWIVVLTVAIAIGSAMTGLRLKTDLYRASAQLLIQPRLRETVLSQNSGPYVDPDRALQSEVLVFNSPPVQDAVRKRLGYAAGVSAHPIKQTNIIVVQAVSSNPARAANTANAYAQEYVTFRRDQAYQDLVAAGQQLQQRVTALQEQIDALAPLVASTTAAAPGATGTPTPEATTQRARYEGLVSQQLLLKQKLDQLQVDTALESGGAQFVTPATKPLTPFSPQRARIEAIAVAVGLIVGAGIALLLDFADDSIKNEDDLARAAPQLPVVGRIPALSRRQLPVVSVQDPSSAGAEAYRSLRTAVEFLSATSAIELLQVTSAGMGEGKTTTVANLGVALARAGQRVIIASFDLRRPRLHELFGMSHAVGFTSVFLGDLPLADACIPVPGIDRLRLLASGPLPPNPSELLASSRSLEIVDELRDHADVVVFDSPPILAVSDGVVLSGRVDATLLVVKPSVMTRKQVARSVTILRQVEAPLAAVVLNAVAADDAYGYGYAYYRANGARAKQRPLRPAPAPPVVPSEPT